jgi:hypothetical protein
MYKFYLINISQPLAYIYTLMELISPMYYNLISISKSLSAWPCNSNGRASFVEFSSCPAWYTLVWKQLKNENWNTNNWTQKRHKTIQL